MAWRVADGQLTDLPCGSVCLSACLLLQGDLDDVLGVLHVEELRQLATALLGKPAASAAKVGTTIPSTTVTPYPSV